MDSDITYVYLPITKSEKDKDGFWVIEGIMTDETVDLDGQIVDFDWAKGAATEWFDKWANVREQHTHNAVGKAISLDIDDAKRLIRTSVKVVDPLAGLKIEEGVLSGQSIGIKGAGIRKDSKAPNGRIVRGKMIEDSLVDHPSNQSTKFVLAKMAGGHLLIEENLDVAKSYSPTDQDNNDQSVSARPANSPTDKDSTGAGTQPAAYDPANPTKNKNRGPKGTAGYDPATQGGENTTVTSDRPTNSPTDNNSDGAETQDSDKNPTKTPPDKAKAADADDTDVEKVIKQVDGKWQVQSEEGKPLGTYDSKAEAVERLRQIEGHKDKGAFGVLEDDYDISWTADFIGKLGIADAEVEKRDFSADERRSAADKGNALPDGSFPINNKSQLKDAIKRAHQAKDPDKAKTHIKKRAKELGATDAIPDDWKMASPDVTKAGEDDESQQIELGSMVGGMLKALIVMEAQESDESPSQLRNLVDIYQNFCFFLNDERWQQEAYTNGIGKGATADLATACVVLVNRQLERTNKIANPYAQIAQKSVLDQVRTMLNAVIRGTNNLTAVGGDDPVSEARRERANAAKEGKPMDVETTAEQLPDSDRTGPSATAQTPKAATLSDEINEKLSGLEKALTPVAMKAALSEVVAEIVQPLKDEVAEIGKRAHPDGPQMLPRRLLFDKSKAATIDLEKGAQNALNSSDPEIRAAAHRVLRG